MSHQSWIAALAPAALAGALAGPMPTVDIDGAYVCDDVLHQEARTTRRWATLRALAGEIDLHPDTVAVLLERVRQPGMFALAGTLLLAGHADRLADLVTTNPTRIVREAGLGGTDLDSWFGRGPVDMGDVLAALGACDRHTGGLILDAYLRSSAPDGDLLDALHDPGCPNNARIRRARLALDERLLVAVGWDARTAAHLVGDALSEPAALTLPRGRGQRPIPDLATWRALMVPAGAGRLAFAVSASGQKVPAKLVPALVALAKAHSTDLTWALLTHQDNLGVAMTTTELGELVDGPRDRYGLSESGMARERGHRLLVRYGHLMDPATKVALLVRAGNEAVATWCVSGALGVGDAAHVRAFAAAGSEWTREAPDVADVLAYHEVTALGWEQVAANPLLLELMLESPTYLCRLPVRGSSPMHAHGLHAALAAKARAALGADTGRWRAFSMLMDNPGSATTTELLAAACALNAPVIR